MLKPETASHGRTESLLSIVETGIDQSGIQNDGAAFLENVNQISRYANDFDQLETIGRGGFGIVYKARHKLDGNIYAIKMIRLSRDNEENKRTLREIKYLSGLNNQYIVRYFQTWVEHETNPDIIAEFADWDEEYDSESDSFEMNVKEDDDNLRSRKVVGRRSQSNRNRKAAEPPVSKEPSWLRQLSAVDDEDEDDVDSNMLGVRRQRANTDQFSLTPDPKTGMKKAKASEGKGLNDWNKLSGGELSDEDDEELLLAH